MNLPAAGREYVRWPILTGLPGGVTELEVSLDGGQTWATAPIEDGNLVVLVAGPDAVSNPAGTLVAQLGRAQVLVRLVDAPEVVIRTGGVIAVR